MKNLISVFIVLCVMQGMAQESSQTQYVAYLKASKTMWEKSVELAKKEKGEKSLETAIALYGLLNSTMASQDEETFNDYKDETIDLLDYLIEKNPKWGEPRAILSSVYGLVMAYSPWKGMVLGMKSGRLMDEAMELQPESALVQRLYGGSKLYTPEMFGGDPEKAMKAYSTSISIYEEADAKVENWHYLDAMMGLAMAYNKIDQKDKAIETLESAIAKEPQFYWAKSELAKLNKS